MAVHQWWFDANIPSTVARSRFYQPKANAINLIGLRDKMPSYHVLRKNTLKNIGEEVDGFREHYRPILEQNSELYYG